MFSPKLSPEFIPSTLTGFFAALSGSSESAFAGIESAAKNADINPLEKSVNSCSGVTRCRSVSF